MSALAPSPKPRFHLPVPNFRGKRKKAGWKFPKTAFLCLSLTFVWFLFNSQSPHRESAKDEILRKVEVDIVDFGAVRDGEVVDTNVQSWDSGALGDEKVVDTDEQSSFGENTAGKSLGSVEVDIKDFGAVGDGEVVNTRAFEDAVAEIERSGGGTLYVGRGEWLTGPFNMTSDMILFLDEGAVILAVEDKRLWPLLPALPSYGNGRDKKGPRYGSFIHGEHLKNITITGNNGTIDGQGRVWWANHDSLNHTRGPLVQFMWSKDIVIYNVTLRNSPFWTFHPYVCNNVNVSSVTILAPLLGAPNTDGIDPDSCKNVLIQNSYISVGDDAISIKSGWDQYGIRYGQPSTDIVVRNLVVRTVVSSGISIGSEMSGGVSNVLVENFRVLDSRNGMRIKTCPGRGGYIRNITYRNITMDSLSKGIVIETNYAGHSDDGYDPLAFPIIQNITFDGISGKALRLPVQIDGTKSIPIRGIVLRDVNMRLHKNYNRTSVFQCAYVKGRAIGTMFPKPCKNLYYKQGLGQTVKLSKSQNTSTRTS